MKKYLCLLLVAATGLLSCSDDDKPVIPELNKLTKITCSVNDSSTPDYVLDVNYSVSDGKIRDIQLNNESRQLYIYSNNTLTITDGSLTTTEYRLSGNTIVQSMISKENKYANNEIYVSDEYTYGYPKGYNMEYVGWKFNRPKVDGAGYDSGGYPQDQKFIWQGDNITLYARDKTEMKYEYSGIVRPNNFPIRLSGTFSPVGIDILSPLNLMFGNLGRNLPERAYRYNVPETSDILAEYKYVFVTDGEYVKGMVIDEKKYEADGVKSNTYKYSFEYNFKVQK